MHGREKKPCPSRPTTKHQTKIQADSLEDYQALIDPSSYEIREKWLHQELTSSYSIARTRHSDDEIQRLHEIFLICIEDVRHMTVVQLANQLVVLFCLWQNSDAVLGGIIDKILIDRVSDHTCPFQLRESAISTLTVFHAMDILRTPKSYQDTDLAPQNRRICNTKYIESFFKILSELVKNMVSNLSKETSHDNNKNTEDIECTSESDECTSEESSASVTEEMEHPKQIDPKDSLLEGIINAWVCLVPLISEDKFDEEFSGFYENFEKLLQLHKNPTIKVAACEAIITLNDLNERLPSDKQYDIEIQPLVDQLYEYAKSNVTTKLQKKQRQTWLNLARALEADKCVVELPYLNIQNKCLIITTKNKGDKRKLYQNRSRQQTFWTNWSEAMCIKYIKNKLGNQFNTLMQRDFLSSKIFSMMEQKDSWHLAKQNSPLSMAYITIKNTGPLTALSTHGINGLKNNEWSNRWWKNTNHGQKENIKASVRNGLFM